MQTEILNFIDGKLRPAGENQQMPNTNPATGDSLGTIPRSNAKDIFLAIEAAESAQLEWGRLTRESRSDWLHQIADRVESRLEEFALAESLDNGKPLKLARTVDIPRCVENFRFFADLILVNDEVHFSDEGKGQNTVVKTPKGVVACISPWNLPLYLLSWKIAPALAAGCTVVAKPSEVTPLTAFLLSQVASEIGLPNGVLNIVHGTGQMVGQALVENPKIQAVSFTGSTQTGRAIARSCAENMTALHLEMGGKNPAIVFGDCDLVKTVDGLLRSSFANQGQICLCSSRLYVEKSIYSEFKKLFVEKVKQLKVGDPLDEETDQGSLVSREHRDKVLSWIKKGQAEGGVILCGAEELKLPQHLEKGNFVAPTVFEGLENLSQTNQNEIFGPVVSLHMFEGEEEAICLANQSQYGLSATVWTEDDDKAWRVSNALEAGMVWTNCWLVRDLRTPFGGVKQSGRGREGGRYILDFFSHTKNICRG